MKLFSFHPSFMRVSRSVFNNSGSMSPELTQCLKFEIEKSWMDKINNLQFENDKEKYYLLSMFPYPSGHLHMGHMRVYTISDAIARFQRLRGYKVIHPIGFDAFGLPAENAAIEKKIHPEEWTTKNIDTMREQLKNMNLSFDWDMEISTCSSSYYKWTQYLFLLLYNSGLAYRKQALVNWDPVDQTVLADEQVDENGCSWRSGCKVEKRKLMQWFFRTTFFSRDLYDGLVSSDLNNWRDVVKIQQHWIGECTGYTLLLKVHHNETQLNEFLPVWTDVPEFLHGATFIALSSGNHFNSTEWGGGCPSGDVKLKIQVYNPLTQMLMPVFVTDSLNHSAATDSYLGIPGYDEQSSNFAIKNQIPVEKIECTSREQVSDVHTKQQRENVIREVKQKGVTVYPSSRKLRDWLISRQRYWGTPIPIIHCPSCKTVPVPLEDLPVVLPHLSDFSNEKLSLKSAEEWVNVKCPRCNKKAVRETDTMDTFVDSSWYFLRYLDSKNSSEIFDVQKIMEMMPVDLYVGGKEHAALHLFYARFMSHFLHSVGMLKHPEPFQRLLMQGMILGQSYRNEETGRYLTKAEVDFSKPQPIEKDTGCKVIIEWEKMSKSKLNGVSPEDVIKMYGIDTTRLFILGNVAPESPRKWTEDLFPGILNWQRRIWLTMFDFLEQKKQSDKSCTLSESELQKYEVELSDSKNHFIKVATHSFNNTKQLSVVISKLQGLTGELRRVPKVIAKVSTVYEDALAALIIMLSPLSPHFASELWAIFSSVASGSNTYDTAKSVLQQKWPVMDEDYPLELSIKLNGKEVDVFPMSKSEIENITKEEAMVMVRNSKKVQQILENKKIQNVLFKKWANYDAEIFIVFKKNSAKATRAYGNNAE